MNAKVRVCLFVLTQIFGGGSGGQKIRKIINQVKIKITFIIIFEI